MGIVGVYYYGYGCLQAATGLGERGGRGGVAAPHRVNGGGGSDAKYSFALCTFSTRTPYTGSIFFCGPCQRLLNTQFFHEIRTTRLSGTPTTVSASADDGGLCCEIDNPAMA